MDLKVSGIGFQGKREILYGLTKAAQNARDYELNQTAYIASRIQMNKYEEQAYKKGTINAYLDMVVRDCSFANVIENIHGKDLKPIKRMLAPFETEHGIVEPMKTFSPAYKNAINNSYWIKINESFKTLTKELLRKLKS